MKTISIDDDVYAHIASRTADIGESASQVLRREMNMGSQLKTVFIEEDVYHYLEQISPGLNRCFPGCLNEGIWRH